MVDLYILIGKLLIPPGVVVGNLFFFSLLENEAESRLVVSKSL